MTTTDAKLNNSIGLAMKAGKIASGDFSVEKAVRSGTAKLVMLDESASENTKKQWRDACSLERIADVCFEDARFIQQFLCCGLDPFCVV